MVLFEVSICDRGFRLRRLAQNSVCDDSAHGFSGCPRTLKQNVALRDRRRRLGGFGGGQNVISSVRVCDFGLHVDFFFESLVENVRFGDLERLFFARVSCKTRARISIFANVSHVLLVLELRILHFRGSFAQNAHFGSPNLQFSRKSRRKRLFWKSGSSILRMSRRICSFWKSGSSVFEVWIFMCGGRLAENVPFGNRNVTAIMVPGHSFKNVTVVVDSRMLL